MVLAWWSGTKEPSLSRVEPRDLHFHFLGKGNSSIDFFNFGNGRLVRHFAATPMGKCVDLLGDIS